MSARMQYYVLAFLCLVATTANLATANLNIPTIYVEAGGQLEIGEPENQDLLDVLSCVLTLNNGTKVVLFPEPDNQYIHNRFRLSRYKCRTQITSLADQDSGIWKIETIVNKTAENVVQSKENSYNLQVKKIYQGKPINPTSSISAYVNEQVSVRFDDEFDNLQSCKLLNFEISEFDLISNKSEHVELSGNCGFKMIAKKDYSGSWTLIAELTNNTAYYAELTILVKDEEHLHLNDVHLFFKIGDKGSINPGNEDYLRQNSKLCILEDPHGFRYQPEITLCSKEIGLFTRYHEGLWKAYYGFTGKENLIEQKIFVHTYETSSLNSSVTLSNGKINLLCQVRSRSVHFCVFRRPDGEMLHMTIGVGNDNYEYYGNGSRDHERFITGTNAVYDCGITIRKPKQIDYGAWRCLIKESTTETLGRVLKVTPPGRSPATEKSIVSASDVYVKRGEPFNVKCIAEEVLSYCWLRSPGGKVYNLIQPKENQQIITSSVKYIGTSLELGDCSAQILVANDTDSGSWTCHMGVAKGPELEANFNVTVHDTHLMAARDSIMIKTADRIDLIYHPLPDSNKVIESCHWINPRGHGINVSKRGRYMTEIETKQCRLSILTVNFKEDLGNWICYARFSDEQEGRAVTMLIYQTSDSSISSLSIGLIISIFLCTMMFGIAVIIMYKRKFVVKANSSLYEKFVLHNARPNP